MAVTLNASNSGTGGLSVTSDATGNLALQTAGTTAIAVDTSQNVGIGTATPSTKLDVAGLVRTSTNGFQSGNITDSYAKFVYDGGSAQLDITNQYNSGGAGSTYGQIVFKNYNSNGGSLTERVRITGSGNILAQKCISVGGATPSSDGSGVTFPATQSASTDANTLDEYEEGTWTPNLGGNTTYSSQVGTYVKIGRLVFANFQFAITSIGTGGSISQINGLPFTSGAASQNCSNLSFGGIAVSIVYGVYYMGSGGVVLNFSYLASAATGLTNNPNIYQNGASMSGSIVYYANA
jgi:hypothetical protein